MSERGYGKEGVGREKRGKEGKGKERKGKERKGKEEYGPIYFVVLKEKYGAVAVAGYEIFGHVVGGVEALDVV